jgi:5-hydroxyisourate hydrolase
MGGGLSIHCVDVSSGRVASGLRVTVQRLGLGVLQHPDLMSDAITAGGYEVRFFVGDFYRSKGLAPDAPGFLEVVPYRFHIAEVVQHYHLPFKFTAWGFSLFRGGA